MKTRALLILILLQSPVLAQQAAAVAPENRFELISIRPDRRGGSYGSGITPGGRFTATNVTPMMLIRKAFDIEPFQLNADPAWIDAERYDVEARTAGSRDITADGLKPLLQAMLADRFALQYHFQTKELPVYSLVVGKTGSKLVRNTGTDPPSINTDFSPDKATMIVRNLTMAAFAKALSRLPGEPVIDNTGLNGTFDFRLEWTPDQGANSSGPSIFTAIQEQLGLTLKSTKGPVEMVVIDHIDRPTEN